MPGREAPAAGVLTVARATAKRGAFVTEVGDGDHDGGLPAGGRSGADFVRSRERFVTGQLLGELVCQTIGIREPTRSTASVCAGGERGEQQDSYIQ